MINFGLAVKRYRKSRSLSQSDFVDLITEHSDSKLSGVDVVTISRWENNVVMPSHRRQVEVFRAVDLSYFDFLMDNPDLIEGGYKFLGIKKSYVWENSESIDRLDITYQNIKTKEEDNEISYCLLYSDSNGVPVGQISYKLINEKRFWSLLRKIKEPINIAEDIDCIVISSIFCISEEIVIHMLGHLTKKILSKEVLYIGYISNNKKSNTKRFFKSVGFQVHHDNDEFTSIILTRYEAMLNKELFYTAIKNNDEGITYES